ncbi:hypothetical protein EV356DRAFT_442661 [Viridothelium virens]|uniref:F-box domain-containing protein n=1 Tax=Viridothelium virens TaxID=1048519 RepID=A0A6A6HGU7_VIRVR|nr:hypothetical protein EV356DRAFT_442661 [Viridothelium virens]
MPDHTLGDNDLIRTCPLDNGRHVVNPVRDLGRLSILPLEILTDIILCLDILSLTVFRRVNNRGMQVVDSIPQYQIIFRYCPDILRGIISTGATYFDLRTLFKSLCDSRCRTCGDFGGYLYLITCLRVCHTCFTENKLFLPVKGIQASIITTRSRKELKKQPHIQGVRGRYADNGQLCRDRLTLWDREAVQAVQTTTSVREKSDRFCNDPRRFMAIVTAPYLELPCTVARWGLYCFGCSESTERETYFRKQYTKQDFVAHIVRYGPVVIGRAEDRPRHSPWGKPG